MFEDLFIERLTWHFGVLREQSIGSEVELFLVGDHGQLIFSKHNTSY